MRVKIGNYKTFYGPYHLAKTLCFWAKPVKDEYGFYNPPDWVDNFGEWLAHGSVRSDNPSEIINRDDRRVTWLYKFLLWIDSKRPRTIKVHIDDYDTWSMDHTLALIICPMLKKLQEKKCGSPRVDAEDVPEELRDTAEEIAQEQKDGTVSDKHHARWTYVLSEMIYAFEKILDDSLELQYYTEEISREEFEQIENKIQNGTTLFGKYYRNLWN